MSNGNLTALGLQLIDEQLKTLNMLIYMGKQDKQKEIKYHADSRRNAATKSHNLVNAIVGGRIVDDRDAQSRASDWRDQAPKLHSGSTLTRQQQEDKIRACYELMGVFS